jgi:hypothetical protein
MVAATKFETFVTDMAAGTHVNALNAQTDTLKVLLTLVAPSVSADSVVADLPAQPTGTGYTSGGEDVTNTAATASGTITVDGTNIVWTAGAADWTDFRYATLYNDTPTSPADPLIMFWDYGSTVSLGNGETFTFNITTNLFTVA